MLPSVAVQKQAEQAYKLMMEREVTEGHGLPCESAKQLGCLPKLPLKNGERSQGHKFSREVVTSDQLRRNP